MTETIRVGHDTNTDIFAAPSSDELAAISDISPLDGLAMELADAATTRKELLTLRVPDRPRVSLRFDPNIHAEDRKLWEERATPRQVRADRRLRGEKPEPDDMKFACQVIAHTCVAVLFQGKEARRDDGQLLTFRDRQLWEMAKAIEPERAIRNVIGNDMHVQTIAGRILLASGLDDDVEEVDPTAAS